MGEIFGVGVVQAINVAGDRVTVTREPIEGINWPAGTMPFQVGNAHGSTESSRPEARF